MKVPLREFICGRLPALQDNRTAAEEREVQLRRARQDEQELYRPGLYAMMDWVASRIDKTNSAVLAFALAGREVDLLTILDAIEIDSIATLSVYAV
jgi:hypothetical protein